MPDTGRIRPTANGLTALRAFDLDLLVRAAEAAADVAGAVIRPFFRNPMAAELKHDASPVTIADRTAELALRAVLSERFPDHGILGEEFPARNPDAALVWVLDPIDGTRAFITGRPIFGTLIALLQDGAPILGIIDQCVTGERWTGAVGRPTRFRSAFGGTAGCRSCPALADAELSLTSPEMLDDDDRTSWARLRSHTRRTTYGGDCYAYGLLALGQIDIIAESNMKIWDWAALTPIVEGAGGQLTDWQGKPLTPDSDSHTLATGDSRLLAQAVAVLDRHFQARGGL